MLLECPHCHRRVLPLSSGECPSCHENTKDIRDADPKVTLLTITEATKFPQTCCVCNEPTKNLVRVRRSGKMAGASQPGKETLSVADGLAVSLFGLFGKLAYLFWQAGKQGEPGSSALQIYVPQCKQCAGDKKIEPASADLEHHRLSILVDKRFATAVNEMNRR
jgi:hypothetical protein